MDTEARFAPDIEVPLASVETSAPQLNLVRREKPLDPAKAAATTRWQR